jgi:gamma-glutamylcyclotransferase (GGCT)/AIG2-like uncharacterized protein YtfP
MKLNYFAYGSNLFPPRLLARVPSARFVMRARLPGYRLCFHKIGADGSAKANAHPIGNQDALVHGVVYQMDATEQPRLDECEGGYDVKQVEIATEQGPLRAFTYIARPELLNEGLAPFHWYKAYIQLGAEYHSIPAEYIAAIEQQHSIPDHDKAREAQHFQLLGLMTPDCNTG